MIQYTHDWARGAELALTIDDTTLEVTRLSWTTGGRPVRVQREGSATVTVLLAQDSGTTNIRGQGIVATREESTRPDASVKVAINVPIRIGW